jgi:hypothetical protein
MNALAKAWKDVPEATNACPENTYNEIRPNDNGHTKSGPKSAATRLVDFANAFSFFHDAQDRSFVRLEINGHQEVWLIESTKFRKLLAGMYYKRIGKAINRNALVDALTTLAGRACHDGPEEPVFLRVAPHGENILIDLCDPQWRVVEVTPNGWQVLDESPVAFVRTGSMQSLFQPASGIGSIKPLWRLLNVTEAQRPLVAGSLLNAFHPHGPYFVLNLVGEQGTAKTPNLGLRRRKSWPRWRRLGSRTWVIISNARRVEIRISITLP